MVFAFILVIQVIYLFFGLLFILTKPQSSKRAQPFEPLVSVVLPARNEGHRLKYCVESLLLLDYPPEKMEIIIVDDDSQDGSQEIIAPLIASKNYISYHILTPELKIQPGKAGALLYGIEKSSGEVVFVTDADCRVPRTWIKGLLAHMTDSTGLVGGFTILENETDPAAILGKIESLDLVFLLTVAASSARLRRAASWIGNNLAFRRQAYDQVGGYAALGFSLIEDMTLVNAIGQKTQWGLRFSAEPDTLVLSYPLHSFKEFLDQHKRWLFGIKDIRPFAKLLIGLAFLSRTGIPVLFFLTSAKLALSILASVLFIDMFICRRSLAALNRLELLKYFFGFECHTIFLAFALPISLIARPKIQWKENTYSSKIFSKV